MKLSIILDHSEIKGKLYLARLKGNAWGIYFSGNRKFLKRMINNPEIELKELDLKKIVGCEGLISKIIMKKIKNSPISPPYNTVGIKF